jgi:hypothetical protein
MGSWVLESQAQAGIDFESLAYPFLIYERITPTAGRMIFRYDLPDGSAFLLRELRAFWPTDPRAAPPFANVDAPPAVQITRPSRGRVSDEIPIPLTLEATPGVSLGGSSPQRVSTPWHAAQLYEWYAADEPILIVVTFAAPLVSYVDLAAVGIFQPRAGNE